MPTHAIQELVVTKNLSTLTVYSSDGNITERFEKNLTSEQFNSIVKVFTDNNFASYGDRYDEGQNYVTDVGFTDITFTVNGKSKTVTTYNFDKYLPAGLVAIREKLQETVEYTRALDESQIKALAESWIREAPTYKYDGSGLALVDYVQQESFPVRHVLTYNFTSSHAGYGDRSDQVTAQVITNHTIKVTIIDGNVDSAIIDGVWDEMDQFMIGSELAYTYQPMMCEKTPWQVWEENSGRVYIRAPTDEEIIRSYYISVYSTEVRDVKKVQSGTMTCQACDICPEPTSSSLPWMRTRGIRWSMRDGQELGDYFFWGILLLVQSFSVFFKETLHCWSILYESRVNPLVILFREKNLMLKFWRKSGKRKHAADSKFFQVVLYARHQTPQMQSSKMRCKNAADL